MQSNIDRVILITGARSGIGAACVRRLARPNTALLLHTQGVELAQREQLIERAETATQAGAQVATAFGDLSQTGQAAALVMQAVEQFGRLDQIISNAGFADKRVFGVVDQASFERAQRAMCGAFFELATAALEPLTQSSWGRVIAVSSFVAHRFDTDGGLFPATAAAKAGLEALAKSLAAQLAASGTTVNCVAPGYTRKDQRGHSALPAAAWQRAAEKTPLGRIAEPDECAALIHFLLSASAQHITGQVIHVDGGLSLL